MPFLVEANPDGSEVTSTLPHRFVVPPNVTEVRIVIDALPVFFLPVHACQLFRGARWGVAFRPRHSHFEEISFGLAAAQFYVQCFFASKLRMSCTWQNLWGLQIFPSRCTAEKMDR